MHYNPNYFKLKSQVYAKVALREISLNHWEFERIENELELMNKYQYCHIILELATMADYAREKNLLFVLKGELFSSLVCYFLGITPLNPIEYELEFKAIYGYSIGYIRILTDYASKRLLEEVFKDKQFNIIFEVPEILTGKLFVASPAHLADISNLPCGNVFKLIEEDPLLKDTEIYTLLTSQKLSGIYDLDTPDIANFLSLLRVDDFKGLVFCVRSCIGEGMCAPNKWTNYDLDEYYRTEELNSRLSDTYGKLLFIDQWVDIYSHFFKCSAQNAYKVYREKKGLIKLCSVLEYRRLKIEFKYEMLLELEELKTPYDQEEVTNLLVDGLNTAYWLKGDFYAEALLTYLTAYNKTYCLEEYKKLYDGVLQID